MNKLIKYVLGVMLIMTTAVADKKNILLQDLLDMDLSAIDDPKQIVPDPIPETLPINILTPKYSESNSIVNTFDNDALDSNPLDNLPDIKVLETNTPFLQEDIILPPSPLIEFEHPKPKNNAQLEIEKIERESKKQKKDESDDLINNQISYEIEPPIIVDNIVADNNNSKKAPETNTTKSTTNNEKSIKMFWIGFGKGAKIDANTVSLGFRYGSFGLDAYKSFAIEYKDDFHDFSIPHSNYYVIEEDAVKNSLGLDLIYFVDLKENQSAYVKGGFYSEQKCTIVQSRELDNAYCNSEWTSYVFSGGIGYLYKYKNLALSAGYHMNRGLEMSIGFALF